MSEIEVNEEKDESSIEDIASEIGWRSDGELDAKAYILKSKDIQATMRDHINTQKKHLTDLNTSVTELKAHNELVYKAEVKKLTSELDTLKKVRKEAIEDGDVEKVEELDGQIDGLKETMSRPHKAANTEFDTWLGKNQWYTDDNAMKELADKIADENEGAPFKTIARLVELEVKRDFPDKFQAVKKPASSPVESASKKITTSKFTEADLSDSQKQTMNQFVKLGILTKKQYIEDIAKTEGAA